MKHLTEEQEKEVRKIVQEEFQRILDEASEKAKAARRRS